MGKPASVMKVDERGRRHKEYELRCLVCCKMFFTRDKREPTCGQNCWDAFIGQWKAGQEIPGLLDRRNGVG